MGRMGATPSKFDAVYLREALSWPLLSRGVVELPMTASSWCPAEK